MTSHIDSKASCAFCGRPADLWGWVCWVCFGWEQVEDLAAARAAMGIRGTAVADVPVIVPGDDREEG